MVYDGGSIGPDGDGGVLTLNDWSVVEDEGDAAVVMGGRALHLRLGGHLGGDAGELGKEGGGEAFVWVELGVGVQPLVGGGSGSLTGSKEMCTDTVV